jgi:hypothetical protein
VREGGEVDKENEEDRDMQRKEGEKVRRCGEGEKEVDKGPRRGLWVGTKRRGWGKEWRW